MKLTLKIKLLPSGDQAKALLETIKEANKACNLVSDIAWKQKLFNQFKLYRLSFNQLRQYLTYKAQPQGVKLFAILHLPTLLRCVRIACIWVTDKGNALVVNIVVMFLTRIITLQRTLLHGAAL